jgi:hypothetical protein
MRYVALIVLVLALAACGSTTTTHHATVARTTAPPSASALAPLQPLTCDTSVGTNDAGNSLTATDVIANLDAVFVADAAALNQGIVSNRAYSVLLQAGADLDNFAGNKLSDDAAAFSRDENGYNPGSNQPDTTYALPMFKDIVKLTADCPKAYQLAKGLPG